MLQDIGVRDSPRLNILLNLWILSHTQSIVLRGLSGDWGASRLFDNSSNICIFGAMLESIPCTSVVEELIAEDGEATLRLGVSEIPNCFGLDLPPSWVFIGKLAMPCSEHLIPFRL